METYNAMFIAAKRAQDTGALQNSKRVFEPLLCKLLREREETFSESDKKHHKFRFTERDIALIGGGMLDASSHTTLGQVLFLVQAFAAYPETQRKAQAEIDELFGNKFPGPDDIDMTKLPYLSACVSEVFRWRPLVPNGVPRECLVDDYVYGYRIPKGSILMFNVWAIHHNPEEYDEPEKFIPERWLGNRLGTKLKAELEKEADECSWRKATYGFGAGRRSCQGEPFAMSAIHVTFVLLVWAFNIVGVEEMDLSLETGVREGASISPNSLKVKFVPRNERVVHVLEEQSLNADEVLKELLPQEE